MGQFFYIAGTDCAVRRRGKVKQQEIFDGPHSDEGEAHEVARQLIVAGDYEVISSPHKQRDLARQEYNHSLGLKVGACTAVGNKYKLKPKTDADLEKDESKSAW